jgi:hypothetical protein
MSTLTAEQLWEIAETMRVGDRVYFEYKLPGGGRWKKDTGTMTKETVELAADPVERYGACQLDSDGNNIMLPQDGKNGTLLVEYRVFVVDRPVAFALSPGPTPPKAPERAPAPAQSAPNGFTLAPTLAVPAPRPLAPTAPAVPVAPAVPTAQTLPPYLQEIARGHHRVPPPEFGMEQCLDPRSWHLLCVGEFETYRLKAWLREFFSGRSKQVGEDYIVKDMITAMELQADVVQEQPSITESSPWVRSMELTISRLFVQRERRLGATPQQIDALQQGFTDAKLPDWIKGAKETATSLLRFQGVQSQRKEGPKGGAAPAKN